MIENKENLPVLEPPFIKSKKELYVLILGTVIFTIIIGMIIILVSGGSSFSFLSEGLLIVIPIVYARQRNIPLARFFRINRVNVRVIASSLVILLGTLILMDALDRIIIRLWQLEDVVAEFDAAISREIGDKSGWDFFAILCSVVVLAAICEEFVFRGIFQGTLEHYMIIPRAILIPAFWFSMLHMIPWNFFHYFLVGILMGWMTFRSRSVVPAVIFHGLYNLISVIFTKINNTAPEWYLDGGFVSPFIVAAFCGLTYVGIKMYAIATPGKEEKILDSPTPEE